MVLAKRRIYRTSIIYYFLWSYNGGREYKLAAWRYYSLGASAKLGNFVKQKYIRSFIPKNPKNLQIWITQIGTTMIYERIQQISTQWHNSTMTGHSGHRGWLPKQAAELTASCTGRATRKRNSGNLASGVHTVLHYSTQALRRGLLAVGIAQIAVIIGYAVGLAPSA